jgi:hypothetical protein
MAAKTHLEYRREKGMLGPFEFDPDMIDEVDDSEYGVYLLTHEADDDDGLVVVVYVGRGEIKQRLTDHLDEGDKDALHFFYKPLDDDDDGFAEECRLFHLYGKRRHLFNKLHPAVPAGSPRNYTRCSERGCKGEAD